MPDGGVVWVHGFMDSWIHGFMDDGSERRPTSLDVVALIHDFEHLTDRES